MSAMGVYKIWSYDRSTRKGIAADGINQLMLKACQKFQTSQTAARLVLEKDGTEVDDDDVLKAWSSEVFLLLAEDQGWTRASSDDGEQPILRSPVMTSARTGTKTAAEAGTPPENVSGARRKSPNPSPTPVMTSARTSTKTAAEAGKPPENVSSARRKSTPRETPNPILGMTTPIRSDAAAAEGTSSAGETSNGVTRKTSTRKRKCSPDLRESSSSVDVSSRAIGDTRKESPQNARRTKTENTDHCSLALVDIIPVLNEFDICGVAQTRGKLYVATCRRKAISVFSILPPFQSQGHLTDKGVHVEEPRDIVAGRDKADKYLFILDRCGKDGNACIWRVDVEASSFTLFVDLIIQTSGTLAVMNDGNILFTNQLNNSLEVYRSDDGSFVERIKPKRKKGSRKSDIEYVLHAIQIRDGSLLVSCGLDDSLHQLLLLSANGQNTLASFGGQRGRGPAEFNNPSHLAVEYSVEPRIFVADEVNGRVIVLDSRLQSQGFAEMKVDGKDGKPHRGKPHRLCYDDDQNYLFVANGQHIHVFSLSDQ